MLKGTLYLDGEMDTERLVILLANNGYRVQIEQVEGFDAYSRQYRIRYKREEEYDEV